MLFEAGAPQRRSDVNRIIGTHSHILSHRRILPLVSPADAVRPWDSQGARLIPDASRMKACWQCDSRAWSDLNA